MINTRHMNACGAGLLLLMGALSSVSAQTPAAPAASDEVIVLSAFTISGERESGYESMQTTSGMRTVQDLKNVANSISVVNTQFIQDIGALTIEDMTQWTVTGEVNPDPQVANGVSRLYFRGIVNNYAIRNGWIWYSPIDSYSTERVELLRGPNAFLYGEADIGGAQNQITKRGQFDKDFAKVKLMAGSYDLLRAEIDVNRRLNDQVALRVAAANMQSGAWWDHGKRDFTGLYAALTYRPFKNTTISVMGEIANDERVRSQGLFSDAFTSTGTATYNNASGVLFLPFNNTVYRLTGRRRSTGLGVGVVDQTIVPREYQFTGPNSFGRADQKNLSFEVEQNIGERFHLLLSGNFYQSKNENWNATTRAITRDLNATLPDGSANPYYNELYTEYQRTHQISGNIVRDLRLSAVYDLELSWMKQQIVVNVQQHQDNPGQKLPKYAEYVSPSNAAFIGTLNSAVTRAAYLANRTVLGSNDFIRRFYLKDGDSASFTGSLGPVPGVSEYFPDLASGAPGGTPGAAGAVQYRRFYTPSTGIGAAGTYFNGHLYTLIGFRRDAFKMKSINGIPVPEADTWSVRLDDPAISTPRYVDYRFEGKNYGAVWRVNDTLAFSYNFAQSYRLSLGDGNEGYRVGTRQGIPYGEGNDAGIRLTLLGGRIEANATYYDNYQPNARSTPLTNSQQSVRDELTALFPDTFNVSGRDTEQITTSGVEVELNANLTSNWRLMFNFASNEVVTEDRAQQLKGFQAEAKGKGLATPELDAFLQTIPEGVPNAGYTKYRANLFTRYNVKSGPLKGFYFGGGINWRDKTFRGNADLNRDGTAEAVWGPAYSIVSLLGGYQTRLLGRPTTFALNLNNVFDKEYYRATSLSSGSWGEPRTFKLTATVEF